MAVVVAVGGTRHKTQDTRYKNKKGRRDNKKLAQDELRQDNRSKKWIMGG